MIRVPGGSYRPRYRHSALVLVDQPGEGFLAACLDHAREDEVALGCLIVVGGVGGDVERDDGAGWQIGCGPRERPLERARRGGRRTFLALIGVLDVVRALDLQAALLPLAGRERAGLHTRVAGARTQLEAAAEHARALEPDRQLVPFAGRERVGNAFERDVPRRCVRIRLEVAGAARVLAEAAGESRRRAVDVPR